MKKEKINTLLNEIINDNLNKTKDENKQTIKQFIVQGTSNNGNVELIEDGVKNGERIILKDVQHVKDLFKGDTVMLKRKGEDIKNVEVVRRKNSKAKNLQDLKELYNLPDHFFVYKERSEDNLSLMNFKKEGVEFLILKIRQFHRLIDISDDYLDFQNTDLIEELQQKCKPISDRLFEMKKEKGD